AISVDASAQKVPKHVVGYGQWAQLQALGRHQTNAEQPYIKRAAAPLDAMTAAPSTASRDRDPQIEATPNCFEKIDVLRRDVQMATIQREISIGRDHADGVGEIACPGDS